MSSYVKFKLTYDGHIMINPCHIIEFQDLDNGESLISVETELRCDSHRVAHTAEKIDKIIRSACRASIKANETMSLLEANQLLDDLYRCKSPYTCPHGRPTMIKLSREEIDKKFGRNAKIVS